MLFIPMIGSSAQLLQIRSKCRSFEFSENTRLIRLESAQKERGRANPRFKPCC